jgi:ubiquitin-like protein Pup
MEQAKRTERREEKQDQQDPRVKKAGDAAVAAARATAERSDGVMDDIDAILDENDRVVPDDLLDAIDEALADINAEDYTKNFVQRGGQ